jgi:hypothetical protein
MMSCSVGSRLRSAGGDDVLGVQGRLTHAFSGSRRREPAGRPT